MWNRRETDGTLLWCKTGLVEVLSSSVNKMTATAAFLIIEILYTLIVTYTCWPGRRLTGASGCYLTGEMT